MIISLFVLILNRITRYHYTLSVYVRISFSRGTSEKLREQVKEAFALPDAPQVLAPTLNFVGGSGFETNDDDNLLMVSYELREN